ncbi:MAG: glycosyl transferase, partial [Clostridia bacterium]|nr:glycosyl transferase [Clostridia bacterium]
MTEEDIKKAVAHCREEDFIEKSFAALKEQWTEHLNHFQAELPDKDMETMVNIWNPYQAERNFQFSRNISYYATGTFRGVGVRDTAQDILAMIPFDLRRAKDKLNLLFTQQYKDGHCNHYCFPTEGWDPVTRIHSDNHLWLVMTTYHIIMEEGNLDYLNERVSYYDGGDATVWEHINKSIDFTESHCGEHGFPLMLASDWNDMLFKVCQKGKGESVWTGMQFGTVLRMISELARIKGEDDSRFCKLYEEQKRLVNEVAWDGEWFRRCITDEGRFIGSKSEPQAKIWLNSQSWAVLSGMGREEYQIQAMDSVKKYLNTNIGIKKIHPAMKNYPTKEDPLTYDKPGCSENGSIFCHANTWAIIAECMLNRPENAYEYYHQLLPMVAQKKVGEWRYKAEPYVYSSNIFGPESDKFGLANVSWLSGTAAWMYIAATQYMLGVKAKWDGLEIDPCLSPELLP